MAPVRLVLPVDRPATSNTHRTHRRYQTILPEAYRAIRSLPMAGQLYGMVIWFLRGYRSSQHPDADNISKPVWDALREVAYADDKTIRWRLAAIVDLEPREEEAVLTELDLSIAPDELIQAIQDDSRRSFLYIELGALRNELYPFMPLAPWSA